MRQGTTITFATWLQTASVCRSWPQRSLLLLTVILLLTIGNLNQPMLAQAPTDSTVEVNTRIVTGSTLSITVTDEPTLSGDFIVSEQGNIHFTISDETSIHKVEWDVAVVGKTADLATQAVKESLKTYLRAPEVQLKITQMPRLRVDIAGPVKKASLRLPLGSHLSDALRTAVCDPNTDYEHVLLLRKAATGGKTTSNLVNFAVTQTGQGDDDPALEAGDRIVLQKRLPPRPESLLKTVRIIGQVGREGDVPVGKNESIRDLLHQIGGLKEDADRKNVVLHRSTGKDYDLDADKIEANDPLFNIAIEPGDFIVVGRRDVSQRFGVSGEVRSGDVYPFVLSEHLTVLGAIERAGGITKKGDPRKGILRRGFLNNPLLSHDLPFDTLAIRKGKAQDWDLIPGDLVVILPKQRQPSIWQNLLPIVLRFLPFGL